MSKQLQIRNSTAEFLIFQAEDKAQGVQVFYQDENIWATQDAIATLFDKGRSTITEHLKNIYQTGELDEQTTCRKFRHMGSTGQEYETKYYNLDAYLNSDERPLLTDAGSVSYEAAQEYAETEFEKYRVIQDQLYQSDFDRFALPTLPFDEEPNNAIDDGSK